MIFANHIVLTEESREAVNFKLELWRETLKTKDFCLLGIRENICIAILARHKRNMTWK